MDNVFFIFYRSRKTVDYTKFGGGGEGFSDDDDGAFILLKRSAPDCIFLRQDFSKIQRASAKTKQGKS